MTLGTLTGTKVGTTDFFIARIDASTGANTFLTTYGKSGIGLYGDGLELITAPSTDATYVILDSHTTAAFSGGGNTTCVSPTNRCCVLAKFTGTALSWITALEAGDSFGCKQGAVTLSADGTKVLAGGYDTVSVLDASTGAKLSTKSFTNVTKIYSIVVDGSEVYVLGFLQAVGASVDSVTVVSPSSTLRFGVLFAFSLSGSTLTASRGTWMGTTEGGGWAYKIEPMKNITGHPKALVATFQAYGSTFELGTGYSQAFTNWTYGGTYNGSAAYYSVSAPFRLQTGLRSCMGSV